MGSLRTPVVWVKLDHRLIIPNLVQELETLVQESTFFQQKNDGGHKTIAPAECLSKAHSCVMPSLYAHFTLTYVNRDVFLSDFSVAWGFLQSNPPPGQQGA